MRRVVVKLLFYVFAAIGLIFQLKDVVRDYFSYRTSSKVELLRQIDSINPALLFCVRFTDVLDRSNYQKYGIHPKRHNDSKKIQDEFSRLTVKDVFHLTPESQELIEDCEYRHDSYHTVRHAKQECHSLFKVLKYFNRQDICYRVLTANVSNNFKCGAISLSLYDRTKIYSIRLSNKFQGSHMISLVSYYPFRFLGDDHWYTLPTESRKYAKSILRLNDFEQNLTDHNSFYISHVSYQLEFLPPPYDTMCTTNPENWKTGCQLACNEKIYGKYGRIPPDKTILMPTNLKMISKKDLENKTFVNDITLEKDICYNSCVFEWCIDYFTVTEVTETYLGTSLLLTATCPMSPTHRLLFYAKHQLDELLIFITSSFGVWFGFSFVALNPTSTVIKMARLRKRKEEVGSLRLRANNIVTRPTP